ncbi:MAG: (2Fe-2S) ferredoxin domain-containing protein [Prochloraceae cyanobacterium]|nr:(2Fe-2S) ferredoxin domain-containing protein [Prochloraceae cyanobacterium]
MTKLKDKVSEFSVIGELLGFIFKDGYKIKYLRILVSEREYWIKLPKELRNNLDSAIKPGCLLKVNGEGQLSLRNGKLKLKATEVSLAATLPNISGCGSLVAENKQTKSKATILVCQKSTCWHKKGGKAVCQSIEAGLRDRGWEDKIKIKTTGCLKQCKKGPNVVVMPDKTKYSQVMPQQIPNLLEKHFA